MWLFIAISYDRHKYRKINLFEQNVLDIVLYSCKRSVEWIIKSVLFARPWTTDIKLCSFKVELYQRARNRSIHIGMTRLSIMYPCANICKHFCIGICHQTLLLRKVHVTRHFCKQNTPWLYKWRKLNARSENVKSESDRQLGVEIMTWDSPRGRIVAFVLLCEVIVDNLVEFWQRFERKIKGLK